MLVTCTNGDGLYESCSGTDSEVSADSGETGRLDSGVFHDGVSIDLIFLLRAVARSAAEKRIPASSAFIMASPTGRELLLFR
jgi:hypothetical protein